MASSFSSTEIRNFQCVTVASVDLIKLPLRDILDSHIKPVDLYHKIQSCSTLKLRPDQLKICLIPPPGVPDYNTFDVTLLYTLIRNLCSLPCPAQGWGNEPRTKDTQISDDIERLRLFRNNYYAHAESAVISNAKFEDVWKNLKLIFKRIQPKTACSIDYEEQLIHIERTKFTDEYLTTFRVLLEALVTLEKQTDDRDEPTVSIRGENEIIWGDTAHFEADVKKADSSCWSITWHRRRGDDIKCIDISVKKYSGSTKRTLVIKSVCKEDEGEYQALLSFESKGPDYKSRNTIRLHVIGDVPSVRIFLDSPVCFGSETIIKSEVSSTPTPEKTEWQKSKDGTDFQLIGKRNIYIESNENFKNPFLVIPKTTFADKLFYRLWVWNRVGKSVSNTFYLNVTGSPPNITTSFVTNIKNKSVKLMAEVYFLENSPGILKTFWTKNGEKIDIKESDGKLSELINDNPSLTITNVGADDAGEYKVTAVNAVGSTTSEVIVLGIPSVFSERVEDEKNGGWRITVTITSFPTPCQIQWNAKSKDDDTFTPIDINADEYIGTTVTFPHPMLVVRQRDQLENNCYQIEVTNFVGKIVQTISGKNKPSERRKDIVHNRFYKDRGARVRFTKLSNVLAKEFPPQKLENLKFTLTNSDIVHNRTSVMKATSALECIRILQDEQLYTQTDVIFMQFLCTQTECLDLHAKCVEYAEQQKALCYFEMPPVNGYKNAQFHIKGELSNYTKDYIQDVIETVAAILDCKVEDILLNGVKHSKSFLLSLSLKEVYMKKLLAMNKQDCLRLLRLNIDYLIIDKETIHLERPKDQGSGRKEQSSCEDVTHVPRLLHQEKGQPDGLLLEDSLDNWFTDAKMSVNRDHKKDDKTDEDLRGKLSKKCMTMYPECNLQDVVQCHLCEKIPPHFHYDFCYKYSCKNCEKKHVEDVSTKHKVVPLQLRSRRNSDQYADINKISQKMKTTMLNHREFWNRNTLRSSVIQKNRQFGSMSALSDKDSSTLDLPDVESSPLRTLLIDEPRIINAIKTEYGESKKELYMVSCGSDGNIWTCGNDNIMRLYTPRGDFLKSIQTKTGNKPEDIAITKSGDLVYIDISDKTVNIVKESEIQPLIILQGYTPRSVCSTSTGDLLVIMEGENYNAHVVRYSGSTEKQCFPYSFGNSIKYITENKNLDICVADFKYRSVVVFNQDGIRRFTYTGHPSNTHIPFTPYGITTDSQSRILTADLFDESIHILNLDGQCLRYIKDCMLFRYPWGLCVDANDTLFVAESDAGKVKRIQYSEKEIKKKSGSIVDRVARFFGIIN